MILADRIKELIYIDYKLNQDLRDCGSCYIGKQDINELHKALKVLNDSNRFRFIVGYNADDPENITYERFDEKKSARVSPEAVIKQLEDTINTIKKLVENDELAIILDDNYTIIIQSINHTEISINIY
ncbi:MULTISPECIES: hypothetical protein [Staphylococcaceae]|uniref:Uncharacterized protein n=2 Tax=Staphylococcaceae TaxID=90964 RepID=A0A855GZF6_9STAP|nr:hypothetical protein [Macrococcus caseolyticus]PKE26533.1 hypothetical protein CW686_04445 [Macrococcus caseolyticus]PKE59161.1 hypothetical protein CW673_04055 [Macrococcus caseolyticus]